MKITIGEWKTRYGDKAIVAAVNEGARESQRAIGWVGEFVQYWCMDGRWSSTGGESGLDLISQWTDPVPWDWSTTPPWINWIAMDANGYWSMYISEPDCGINVWNTNNYYTRIPPSHAPKWIGDWKLSKTMRPKEVAK